MPEVRASLPSLLPSMLASWVPDLISQEQAERLRTYYANLSRDLLQSRLRYYTPKVTGLLSRSYRINNEGASFEVRNTAYYSVYVRFRVPSYANTRRVFHLIHALWEEVQPRAMSEAAKLASLAMFPAVPLGVNGLFWVPATNVRPAHLRWLGVLPGDAGASFDAEWNLLSTTLRGDAGQRFDLDLRFGINVGSSGFFGEAYDPWQTVLAGFPYSLSGGYNPWNHRSYPEFVDDIAWVFDPDEQGFGPNCLVDFPLLFQTRWRVRARRLFEVGEWSEWLTVPQQQF